MACPGSINLIDLLPERDTEASGQNIAARQGKCAHLVAQRVLEAGPNAKPYARDYVGQTFFDVEVTEEMAEHVQLYVDTVLKIASIPGVQYWIERKFSLASLNPPMPMFGTADFSAYDPATRTLYVVDLKYGMGAVEIKDNKQTRYYALGVWLSLPPEDIVETVTMMIVQPRMDHPDGFVRPETIHAADLSQFAVELLDAARATQDPKAPLHSGDHCKFCPAKPICPELYRKTQEIAATEFDEMPVAVPPAPASLSPEQLSRVMKLLPILDDWSAAVKEHVERQLRAGEPIEGFKLVERRAERKWIDEDEAAEVIEEIAGVGVDIYIEQLKSPAQIEKLVGKKTFKEKIAQHVVKKSSGLKLVPEDHPSPPVLMGGTEFDALPAPDSENEGKDKETKNK